MSQEKWAAFGLDRQILMIANEMHRAAQLMEPEDRGRLRNAYERVLNLTDLTVRVQTRRTLQRELLRWRDLVGALYVAPDPDPQAHAAALHVLLLFTPEAAKQRPYV